MTMIEPHNWNRLKNGIVSGIDTITAIPQRLVNALFGYDFFISYAHADGVAYPEELDRQLREKHCTVHLDSRDFHAGSDLTLLTRIRVQNSRVLVVIGGEEAARESYWVRREFEIFQATGRSPIVIDIDGSVESALADPPIGSLAKLIADQRQVSDNGQIIDKFLRERDNANLRSKEEPRIPGPALASRLESRLKGDRIAARRVRWLLSAVAVLAVSTIATGIGAVIAVESSRQAAFQRDIALGRLVAADARDAANEPDATVGHQDRALLLAALSHRLAPGANSESALLSALDSPKGLAGYLYHDGGPRITSVAFNSEGTAITSAEDGTLLSHPLPVGSAPPTVTSIGISQIRSIAQSDIDPIVHAFGGMAGEIVFCLAELCAAAERSAQTLNVEVTSLAISADGTRFASGLGNGTILIHHWDHKSSSALLEDSLEASEFPIDSLAFDEGDLASRWLTSASREGEVVVWDLTEPSPPRRLGKTGFVLYHLQVDIASGRLVTGGGVGDVRLWNLQEEQSSAPMTLPIHEDSILAMLLEDDHLYVSDAEGHLIAWDLAADPPEPKILERSSDVWNMALSSDGTTLATIDETGEIALWDVNNSEPARTIIGKHKGVYKGFSPYLAFDNNGLRLLVGGGSGDISVWDLRRGSQIATIVDLPRIALPYQNDRFFTIAGDRIALVSAARQVNMLVFEADTLEQLHEIPIESNMLNSTVNFASSSDTLAITYGDGFATAVSAATGITSCTSRLTNHSLHEVATNRTGSVLVGFHDNLGLEESEIHVSRCVDGDSGGVPVSLFSDSQRPTAIALSSDGRTLFSGHQDGKVFAWDLNIPQPIATLIATLRSPVTILRYSDRRDAILAGFSSGQILLVSRSEDGHRFLLPRQVATQLSYVTDLALSPDGTRLAAIDLNGRLVLWDPPTGRRIHLFRETFNHQGKISFSESGDELRLVADGTVLHWNMNPDAWASLACQLANRSLRQDEIQRYLGLPVEAEPCPA